MIYLDTGIIVRALLAEHPRNEECLRLVNRNAMSSSHAFAEVFNTLTGHFKVQNALVSEMIQTVSEEMSFEVMSNTDYLTAIREAKRRGIQGGLIYDAIHAQVARRLEAERIITYNCTHFRHVAPDLLITSP